MSLVSRIDRKVVFVALFAILCLGFMAYRIIWSKMFEWDFILAIGSDIRTVQSDLQKRGFECGDGIRSASGPPPVETLSCDLLNNPKMRGTEHAYHIEVVASGYKLAKSKILFCGSADDPCAGTP